ncbi:hypothetical protein M758_7G094300 [Ceratodon purpureus]|uniref:Uncharacterized protein n=1 Tax=Ceratodon purpureus TaxID=3225 RepID=A0A8T0H6V8_CERPU|nr:hypothetical protein KC19_7G100700 [Ceratodon purpureus]KAG0610822.1 hypothetical protein M758_7G094300 [Ceratodon purpureus]
MFMSLIVFLNFVLCIHWTRYGSVQSLHLLNVLSVTQLYHANTLPVVSAIF